MSVTRIEGYVYILGSLYSGVKGESLEKLIEQSHQGELEVYKREMKSCHKKKEQISKNGGALDKKKEEEEEIENGIKNQGSRNEG